MNLIPPGATILEIGSGTGRDAQWLEAQGFRVIRTEASAGLRDYLRRQGHTVLPLNVLTDDMHQQFAMIHANAVLLHFTPTQLTQALQRLHRWLAPGGVFTCSVKHGQGQGWESEKLGQPRFFSYWTTEDFVDQLRQAGFEVITVMTDKAQVSEPTWIMTTARRSRPQSRQSQEDQESLIEHSEVFADPAPTDPIAPHLEA